MTEWGKGGNGSEEEYILRMVARMEELAELHSRLFTKVEELSQTVLKLITLQEKNYEHTGQLSAAIDRVLGMLENIAKAQRSPASGG
jgi:hypothetical protein